MKSNQPPFGIVPGIVPGQLISNYISVASDAANRAVEPSQIQPASLDLRLGNIAYRTRASFLPGLGKTVSECLESMSLHSFNLDSGAVLERGAVYLIPAQEGLRLDEFTTALTNPKSSTGRLDVFARVICDQGTKFDQMPHGYQGKLFVELSPRSFPIKVQTGSRLVQLRLRHGERNTSLPPLPLELDAAGDRIGALIGYRAKLNTALVDIDKTAAHNIQDYWQPIYSDSSQSLILDPSEFYILASRNKVEIAADKVAELLPVDTEIGEFRVHYAGFFDPGFGLNQPSQAVLEIRAFEIPFKLDHGQVMGKLLFEPLSSPCEVIYGEKIGSNYQGQGLALSKHFK